VTDKIEDKTNTYSNYVRHRFPQLNWIRREIQITEPEDENRGDIQCNQPSAGNQEKFDEFPEGFS
jgi:hypothetical protein